MIQQLKLNVDTEAAAKALVKDNVHQLNIQMQQLRNKQINPTHITNKMKELQMEYNEMYTPDNRLMETENMDEDKGLENIRIEQLLNNNEDTDESEEKSDIIDTN
eukprot:366618_1